MIRTFVAALLCSIALGTAPAQSGAQTRGVEIATYYSPTKSLTVDGVGHAQVSDSDYYFTSRLRGEPLAGIHCHPAVPRTARLSLVVGF